MSIRPRATHKPILAALVLLGLGALSNELFAIPTATFEVSSFEELDKGQPKGTLISSEGEIVAGRNAWRVKSGPLAMVWSRAVDSAGNVYFGTGDPGQILAVRGSTARVVTDLKTVLVTALAVGPGGKLLAGTMPDAKILEVDPKSGTWRQLAKLPTAHVWALVHDPRTRRIYAGSGAPGKVFSIPEGGGTPSVYYDPGEQHVLSLAVDGKGHVLAGSAENAILYRITAAGKASAMHDFDASELRRVLVGPNGAIYLAVNKFPGRTAGLPRYDAPEAGEAGTPLKSESRRVRAPSTKLRPQELRPGAKQGKGALYRIDPQGHMDELLTLDKGYFTDLELDGEGMLWAADGAEGKVYFVRPDRTVLTAFDLPERQVLALAVTGKAQYLGMGDAGAIYQVSASPSGQPSYQSKVFDAKFPSQWGQVHVQGSAKVKLMSRSGNTAKPDKTWSGWHGAQPVSAQRMRLTNPVARYVQVQVNFQAPFKGALRSFAIHYRPQNQRATISEVTVDDAGARGDKGKAAKLKIKWKMDNPDGDPLVYRVYFREEMGVNWRKISGHDPLEKTELEWDTEPVADDYYRIKVVASDEKGNGAEHVLKDSKVSAPVLIDNRKPEITGLSVRYPMASGLARDSYSAIQLVEYSVDGKRWRTVSPNDGVYDSPAEGFRLKLPGKLKPGTHILAVRAKDSADNLGVAQIRFVK
ncbi:MAG: hypothetical protein IT371_08145 [Deltaproteobacteria bacterium]|nr:hypothetical protein [Deltaproteobacteria bacterium]